MFIFRSNTLFTCLFVSLFLISCAPQAPLPSPGHLDHEKVATIPDKSQIPSTVQSTFLPPPQAVQALERYTVVVDRVPVKELLFALARDAKLNVDIDPAIEGVVTINAVDQTLPQILKRIARQVVNIKHELIDGNLVISQDLPYVHTYQVDYLNMHRDTKSQVSISTQVANTGTGNIGGGGSRSGNNSKTELINESSNNFWKTLESNVTSMLIGEEKVTKTRSEDAKPNKKSKVVVVEERTVKNNVMVSPESGTLTVRATAHQHEEIQTYLNKVMNNVQRQVLIEATLVEIQLSDQYQAGVDWTRIAGNFSYIQALTAGALGGAPAYTFSYNNPNSGIGNISSTIKLLSQYGQTKILSSPKIMTLNNQTAILKVVNNRVYFSVGVENQETSVTGSSRFSSTTTTEIHTVPEGLVMSLTPHISDNDQVIINVRPTISRIVGFVNDPNPLLAQNNIVNRIPVVQVREIETVLKVQSGNVAIMGGLMQDEIKKSSNALPGISDVPIFGDLFKYRDDEYTKTELVIFLRPIVIKDASLTGDLHEYRRYLPDSSRLEGDAPTTIPVNLQTLYPHIGQ